MAVLIELLLVVVAAGAMTAVAGYADKAEHNKQVARAWRYLTWENDVLRHRLEELAALLAAPAPKGRRKLIQEMEAIKEAFGMRQRILLGLRCWVCRLMARR